MEGRHQNDISSEEERSIDKDIDERYLISDGNSGPINEIKNEAGRGGGCFSARNFNE